MSIIQNTIDLHIESLQKLSNIQLIERSIDTIKKNHNLMISVGCPIDDKYFDDIEELESQIESKAKKYLKENELLRTQVLDKFPHLKK